MEEADNRFLLHIKDAINCGLKRILLKTVDSAIVVTLLGFTRKLFDFNADIKVWVKFNSGMNGKLINMNTTLDELGGEITSGIIYFRCFSGYDYESIFQEE